MSNAAMSNAALAEPWKELWNGDLSQTEKIIAEDFAAHAAPLTGAGPDLIRGREALNAWVSGIHAVLSGLAFDIEVGPITDGEYLVLRWRAHGTYGGGFPGASADAVGRPVTFTGTDTLRVAGGKLAEYWANADSLLFVQQLGVRELPAPVRAMVRAAGDHSRLPEGVEIAVADFDDPASLAAALTGTGRAYLVTPSSEQAEAQQLRFADLAAQAGVRHLVKLSQLAAAPDSPVRFLRYHAAVEQHVRDLGIGYTFLRPNLFFQGLLAFAKSIAADGRFFAPIGDAAVSAVDVRDIADVAAVALSEPGHEGVTYTLTGPAAVTHAQIAAALTAATGHEITFTDAPPEAFAGALHGIMPPWQVDGLIEDYAHYRRGEAAAVSPAVAEVTGRPPRDVAQFARDYASAFSA
jgi:uncharacterized protein YbjT (DUF2867 family)